jgi:aminoglycoside phosphotransferase (APT) family kinase protein
VKQLYPIIVEEIPHSIKKYVKQIEKVTFPKQGCTSDVGILHPPKRRYVLKRAKREKYRKWLYKEYYVLKNIQVLADFQSPSAYKFVQTAVIDWSGGTCGDARYDMALAVRFEDGIFTGKERAAFFNGYGKGISQGEFCYFAEGLYEFF